MLDDVGATVGSGDAVGGSAWLEQATIPAVSAMAMPNATAARRKRRNGVGRESSDDFEFAGFVGSRLRMRGAPLEWLLGCTC